MSARFCSTWPAFRFPVVLFALVCASEAFATEVASLSIEDTVRQTDAIAVGTILSHRSYWGDVSKRWMQSEYTLSVENVVYPSEQRLTIGQTITLKYWGGTVGDEMQSLPDIRVPVDGEHVVMLLHPRWAEGGTAAPTV